MNFPSTKHIEDKKFSTDPSCDLGKRRQQLDQINLAFRTLLLESINRDIGAIRVTRAILAIRATRATKAIRATKTTRTIRFIRITRARTSWGHPGHQDYIAGPSGPPGPPVSGFFYILEHFLALSFAFVFVCLFCL